MSFAIYVFEYAVPNKKLMQVRGIRIPLFSIPESEFMDADSIRDYEGWVDGCHLVTLRSCAGMHFLGESTGEQSVKLSMANCRLFDIEGWPYDDRTPRWILPDPGMQARTQNGIIDLAISSASESSGVVMGYLGQSIMYNFIAPGFMPPPAKSKWDIAVSALVAEGDLIPFVVCGERLRGVLRIGKHVKDRMYQMSLHLPNSAISVAAGSTLISRTRTSFEMRRICSESLIGRVESITNEN